MKTLLTLLLFVCTLSLSAQDIIQMEKVGGVYKVPCKINGLSLKFIFDTGASDVSLSLSEAVFMVKNGYLNESDFRGTETYRIANGDIAEGTKVNLRKVEFGKQTLYNVEASIVHSMDAPLLLGQSVLQRLGKFSVDYSNNALIVGGGSVVSNKSNSNSNTTSTTSSTTGTVTDINGKVYKTVKIGNQWWMAENLNVDRFRNGDIIHEAKIDEEWQKSVLYFTSKYVSVPSNSSFRTTSNECRPAWCNYGNSQEMGIIYGKLYNWYSVADSRGLCPTGWHVPSECDWNTLVNHLGNEAGKKLKSTTGWKQISYGTNASGFAGIPGGYRNGTGSFDGNGYVAEWWVFSGTNTAPDGIRGLIYFSSDLISYPINKEQGLNVRCIKD